MYAANGEISRREAGEMTLFILGPSTISHFKLSGEKEKATILSEGEGASEKLAVKLRICTPRFPHFPSLGRKLRLGVTLPR